MKLLYAYPPESKTVDYHGIELAVPFSTRYLACNNDGYLWAFCFYKPFPNHDTESWHKNIIFGGNMELVGKVDLEGLNWQDSLVAYSKQENEND